MHWVNCLYEFISQEALGSPLICRSPQREVWTAQLCQGNFPCEAFTDHSVRNPVVTRAPDRCLVTMSLNLAVPWASA